MVGSFTGVLARAFCHAHSEVDDSVDVYTQVDVLIGYSVHTPESKFSYGIAER